MFAQPTDLEFRTFVGSAEAYAKPTSDFDLRGGYKIINKHGNRALGASFGFGSYNIVAAPIKERIHEFSTDLGYTQETWNVGFNYTGNVFDNRLDSYSVDNSRMAASSASASDVGRVSLSPDNSHCAVP